MNKQEILVALLTALGWTEVTILGTYIAGKPPQKTEFCRAPNLIEDLNAIAEVRKTLTRKQQVRFIDELRQIINDANRATPFWLGATPFHYVDASAAEQAQALLEVLKSKS